MARPELLLHPQIPPPLHGLAPRTVMGRTWWDKQRRLAYTKNEDRCHCCEIHKSKAKYRKVLEAHEAYNIDWAAGRVELDEIVALCHSCHNYIHRGLMEMLVSYDKMPSGKMHDILAHGSRIIEEADPIGLLQSFKTSIPKVWAPWQDWVLVIENKEYPGRFLCEDEWHLYYEWLNTTGRRDSKTLLETFRGSTTTTAE